jgi:hypothetical protein
MGVWGYGVGVRGLGLCVPVCLCVCVGVCVLLQAPSELFTDTEIEERNSASQAIWLLIGAHEVE